MATLRTPETGCPWDLEQNFASIAPYTIEEAYEVADAIDRVDMDALKDELGDLLLQVAFHARMAEEIGAFDMHDVVDAICTKMIRRHPHVFAQAQDNTSDQVVDRWESIKASERAKSQADNSALAGVALALPSLLRAQKLQKRAKRTGFDWPDINGALDKLEEEIGELKSAESKAHQAEEMGDLLFAAVNVCRHLDIDAEQILKQANSKFERRFRSMETIVGDEFSALSLEEKEDLWIQVKQMEPKLHSDI
jgi:nucleoside triphosphate diphosphatase